MTINELSQYRSINIEIKLWEAQLDELRKQSVMKSKEITGMPFSNTNATSDPTSELAIRLADLELKVWGHKYNIIMQSGRIYDYIMSIEDSYIRIITKLWCDGKTWSQIASEIHSTPDAARMTFKRYIKTHL